MEEEYSPVAVLRLYQAVVAQALKDAVRPIKRTSRPIKRRTEDEPIEKFRKRKARYEKAKRKMKESAKDFARRKRETELDRNRKFAEEMEIRKEARDWLTYESASFNTVVSLAGLDPEAVHDRARKLAAQGWPCHVEESELDAEMMAA